MPLDMKVSLTTESLFHAIDCRDHQHVADLLSAGLHPDSMLIHEDLITRPSTTEPPWQNAGDYAPSFRTNKRQMTALQYIASLCAKREMTHKDKGPLLDMMSALLDYGSDLYFVSHQPLREHLPSYFPGDDIEQGQTDSDLDWCSDDEREDSDSEDETEYTGSGHDTPSTQSMSDRQVPPRAYGSRTVIHSMLEDGAYCYPVLRWCQGTNGAYKENLPLDMEHRDPQGRTIILAACRSALGADAAIDGTLTDASWSISRGAMESDCFRSVNARKLSIFDNLCARAPDLLAVDCRGKHVLHHLLESDDGTARPPSILKALRHVLERHPHLSNQPDYDGNYPLHVAFQRLRRYPCGRSEAMSDLDSAVDALLIAGADSTVRDKRNNNMIHYLAAARLADVDFGYAQKRWLRFFLSCGLDVNLRNMSDLTALELLLQDSEQSTHRHLRSGKAKRDERDQHAVDAEVLHYLYRAGLDFGNKNNNGDTVFHSICKQTLLYGMSYIQFAMHHRVDFDEVDGRGRSVIDIIEDTNNQDDISQDAVMLLLHLLYSFKSTENVVQQRLPCPGELHSIQAPPLAIQQSDLLVEIFSHLNCAEMLRSSAVNRHWQRVVSDTPLLERLSVNTDACLQRSHVEQWPLPNSLLLSTFPVLYPQEHGFPQLPRAIFFLNRLPWLPGMSDAKLRALKRRQASWRNMFTHEPPVKRLEVIIKQEKERYSPGGDKILIGVKDFDHRDNLAGLRMGELHDLVISVIEDRPRITTFKVVAGVTEKSESLYEEHDTASSEAASSALGKSNVHQAFLRITFIQFNEDALPLSTLDKAERLDAAKDLKSEDFRAPTILYTHEEVDGQKWLVNESRWGFSPHR